MSKRAYHHGDLRNALITTAIEMILESGVEALSMRALARRVGVSAAAYAYHFPDKAALLVAIATEGFRKLNEAFGAAVKINDRYQRFYKLAQCYLDFALNNPGHYQVMFSGTHWQHHQTQSTAKPDQIDEEFFRVSSHAFETLHATVRSLMGRSKADRSTVNSAMVVWSQYHGAVMLWQQGMFAPPIADEPVAHDAAPQRDEAEFRALMRRTAEDFAAHLSGSRVPADV
jgi:AcrR family transcriptional regulator